MVVRATESSTPYVTSEPMTGSTAAVVSAARTDPSAPSGTAYQAADCPALRRTPSAATAPSGATTAYCVPSTVAVASAEPVGAPDPAAAVNGTARVRSVSVTAVKLTNGEPSATTTRPITPPPASSSSIVTVTAS